ncbi:MAG: hypothetical protein MJA29_06800 [Candidatus Omnitrophica bacterium]|nr:hypothetical protein [Candidatus Omnitrophota bacterium]
MKRIVILSGDTDVFVLGMYFLSLFNVNGVCEVWFKGGVASTTRYIPIHVLAKNVGRSMCEILPAIHALSGSDVTSKVGTKSSALKADPEKYLKGFGKPHTNREMPFRSREIFSAGLATRARYARNRDHG